MAVDSALNHLTVVVNGKKLEDKAFPIPAGEQPPSDLTEKLLIFKNYIGFWPDLRNVKYFAEIKFEFKILPKKCVICDWYLFTTKRVNPGQTKSLLVWFATFSVQLDIFIEFGLNVNVPGLKLPQWNNFLEFQLNVHSTFYIVQVPGVELPPMKLVISALPCVKSADVIIKEFTPELQIFDTLLLAP